MARTQAPRLVMSRKRRNTLIAAVLLIVLPFAIVLDRQLMLPVRQAMRRAAWIRGDDKRYHEQTFTVVAVIDGDTLDIDAPDGDRPATRIRLLGVDAPETQHPRLEPMFFGKEATDFVRDRAEGKQVTVLLDTVAGHRDRYGRLLAYVVLPDGEVLNEAIIRRGLGYADLRFEHSHYEAYREWMDAAIAQRTGLWQAVTRDQLPSWLQRRRPDLQTRPGQ